MVDVRFGVVYVVVVAPLPPLTFSQTVDPSADCCHWIVPVCPLTLTVVELPEHIGLEAAVAIPPTDVGETVTVPVALLADAHVSLVITAL